MKDALQKLPCFAELLRMIRQYQAHSRSIADWSEGHLSVNVVGGGHGAVRGLAHLVAHEGVAAAAGPGQLPQLLTEAHLCDHHLGHAGHLHYNMIKLCHHHYHYVNLCEYTE